jgi:acetyl-CoA acetyltransferase
VDDVRVIGAAMTPQGRLEEGAGDLARAALEGALADAGLELRDLGLVLVSNSLGGFLWDQEMIRGQVWLRSMGFEGTPVVNIENACAGGAAAMHVGCLATQGGASPVAVVGVEKMWHEDRAAASAGIEQGLAADERATLRATYKRDSSTVMGLNSMWAEELMSRGATREHFAAAAAKNYRHGSLNPLAQHRTPRSAEEILASRVIDGPLTRGMCSSFTDGAAAVVLAGTGPSEAPRVLASAMCSGDGTGEYHQRLREAAELAWKMAGIGPDDIDVLELHDVTSSEELFALEAMGFFEPGAAGSAVAEGFGALGSTGLVVSPSGGLLARGHALGATGLCQVVEVVDQLRGRAGERQIEAPRIGMTINTGGILMRDTAVCACHIITN